MRSLVPAIVMVVGIYLFQKTYSRARKVRGGWLGKEQAL